jgi:hypothetical protein
MPWFLSDEQFGFLNNVRSLKGKKENISVKR